MNLLATYLPNLSIMFHLAFLFMFTYYGWVLFVIGILSLLRHEYIEEIQAQFISTVEWVFLEVSVPKTNMVSTLAVENIFAQMHVLHSALTFEEIYVQGKFQLWYSLEIVSLGGKVSFIIRTPKKTQHLVESAFYSQYPGAEIREVSDYMANVNINPYKDDSDYEIFGTEWKMKKDSVIPMKTYKDFEHPSAEVKIIDPLTNVIETLERIKPHELLALQILIQPIQNNEWGEHAKLKIKELTGEEVPHAFNLLKFLLAPVDWFANLGKAHAHGAAHGEQENRPRNNWLNMSEGEKQQVTLIEGKMNKACYNTKIRLFYMAPKDSFDKGRSFEMVGAIRHLSPGGGEGIHNTISPDLKIWTKVDAYFSHSLEKKVINWKTRTRKYWFLRGYKNRSIYVGSSKFLLSVEEIATLFHFPITTETTMVPAGVLAVASKKSRPPSDLPVLE